MAENFSRQSFHIQTTNYSYNYNYNYNYVGVGYEDEVEQVDPTYSFSPPPPNTPSFHGFDSGPESESVYSEYDLIANPNSFFYGNEDQMDFTDLFDAWNDDVMEHPHVVQSNSNARVLQDGEEVEFRSELDGLRVVEVESESESEDMEVIHQIGDLTVPELLNCFEDDYEGEMDADFQWEEVDRVEGREDMMSFLNSRLEEFSVSEEEYNGLGEDGEEEQVRNLEWEFLVAVNDLERRLEFHTGAVIQDDGVFGNVDFVGIEERLKGSPPAAKSVLENLPLVVLSDEYLKASNVACAVCKDEILLKEKVTRLPCSHYYHCDCIVPWLNIRNTCPVCRHELPTDDADYERKKGRSAGPAVVNNFQVQKLFPINCIEEKKLKTCDTRERTKKPKKIEHSKRPSQEIESKNVSKEEKALRASDVEKKTRGDKCVRGFK